MSKWRPTASGCIYVIPDIHGGLAVLQTILDRILPLRKINGVTDSIVFLGDYIDRGPKSPEVLDCLIALKEKYKEHVIFLMGNHEMMFLHSFDQYEDSDIGKLDKVTNDNYKNYDYAIWYETGGEETALSYIKRAGRLDDAISLLYNPSRLVSTIPKEHLVFLKTQLVPYHIVGNMFFVHGGCDPYKKLEEHTVSDLLFNTRLCRDVLAKLMMCKALDWDFKIVTGHNMGLGKCKPIVTDKFVMLDCGSPKQLLVWEAHSGEAFMSIAGNSRLVKYKMEDTKVRSSFKRAD